MKKFLKDNSDAIRKFFMTHLVMSLLGIMIGLAVIVFEGSEETDSLSILALIAGLFTVGFLCFLHYDDMYFIGARHSISARGAGETLDPLRGLKITLIAYSPTLIVALVTIIIDLFVHTGDDNARLISLLIYYIFQGSFIPFYSLRVWLGVSGYVLVTLIPTIIASVLGYAIGSHDKTLRGLLGFKVKPPYDGPVPDKKRRRF